LRRTRSIGDDERQQYIEAQRDAMQDVVFQAGFTYYLTLALGILTIAVVTYFEVRSVYVLVVSYGDTCDRPLWWWLLGHCVLSLTRELLDYPNKNIILGIHMVWLCYGMAWFAQATQCRETSPELFLWTEVILFVAAVLLVATTLLPLLVYGVVFFLVLLVSNGLLPNSKAARSGTVDRLQVINYEADTFAPPAASDADPRPSGECCCCVDVFSDDKEIVKTPCGHFFHKECLGDWLKLAKTCPLCRCDLEEAVWVTPEAP
jgi:hypothetical protein